MIFISLLLAMVLNKLLLVMGMNAEIFFFFLSRESAMGNIPPRRALFEYYGFIGFSVWSSELGRFSKLLK